MHALRILEFDSILQRLQFHCETPIAGAMAEELVPSFQETEVWDLLALTGEAHDALARHHVPSMGSLRDWRSALNRASKGAVLGGQELFGIGEALAVMRQWKSFLQQRKQDYPGLAPYGESLPEQQKVEGALTESLEPDGAVKDSASVALANIRQRKKSTLSRIQERIQSYTTGRTRELLSDPIYTVRDGRYVIPVKSENRGKIRGIVHDTSASGQTVYLEPEDVLQLGNTLRELESNERIEEHKVLTVLSGKVGAVAKEAIGGVEAASRLDLIFAKARLAFEMRATMPVRQGTHWLEVRSGRHPDIDPASAVPLNLAVGKGKSVLITGPNTGGKTVAIKTVGLFVLMAQSGMMLPALEVRLGPFTQIWADIGDEQSLQQSLSTFSGHIKNIGEALKFLKDGALVLLDEVGAGTDPAEGAALAKAILSRMHQKGATILASTHYGELKAFAYQTDGFENAAMEFDSKTLRPTYRLLMGSPGASHALRIAERYGIPKEVVEEAKTNLGQQAQELSEMFEKLEASQRQARIAQGEADRRAAELKRAEDKAAKKLAEADEIRRNASARANETIEAALREIRMEASRIFEELKQSSRDGKSMEQARKSLKDLQEAGQSFANEIAPRPPRRNAAGIALERGMAVKVANYSQPGTILEISGSTATVQVGPIKMSVPLHQLEPSASRPEVQKARPNIRLAKAMTASTEIHLRHMRAEDAIQELERFLDDSVLGGVPSVRIVHGKGEGILRKVTQELLKKNPNIASFRTGEPAEGGEGVTIATLR
jgi:DNA mismatch repair protein MutS2